MGPPNGATAEGLLGAGCGTDDPNAGIPGGLLTIGGAPSPPNPDLELEGGVFENAVAPADDGAEGGCRIPLLGAGGGAAYGLDPGGAGVYPGGSSPT